MRRGNPGSIQVDDGGGETNPRDVADGGFALNDAQHMQTPGRWATILVCAIAGIMIASWLPAYLQWPWWPDLDAWATIAQGWDAGILPYRDVEIFNFPGQIEICWILGKLGGWGKTWPFYAFDAGLLIGFGGCLALWSRRVFGRALPGLLGWLATLSVYLNLDYAFVAQRDWQGPLLAISGLLMLQGGTRRGAKMLSALLVASGFAIRPHVVLWVPVAMLVIAWEAEGASRAKARSVVVWGAVCAGFVVLWFAPLIAQGLIGDLVRGVRQASYGGGYGKATWASVANGVMRQGGLLDLGSAFATPSRGWATLRGWRVVAMLVGLAIFAGTGRARLAWPWFAALGVGMLYEPLHPKRHAYLALPLLLVGAVAFGALSGLILERLQGRARAAVWVFAGLVVLAVPGLPSSCDPSGSLDVLMGRESSRVPPTAAPHFYPGDPNTPYRWEDYRSVIAYLRRNTDSGARVMNMLRNVPFPSVNALVSRITLWPAESGVIWLWSVNPEREVRFVEALSKAPAGSVVVWSPGEPIFDARLRLDRLVAEVRRGFRPEARFGSIEVWRKKSLENVGGGD